MIRILSALSLIVGLNVQASELDNEAAYTNQALQGTMVVRIDQRDNSVSYLQVEEALSSQDEALQLIQSGEFKSMPSENLVNELDKEAGASSWYYYYVPYYSSYYNNYCLSWYGYNYYPYYRYNYGYYSYYYYGWNYRRWW